MPLVTQERSGPQWLFVVGVHTRSHPGLLIIMLQNDQMGFRKSWLPHGYLQPQDEVLPGKKQESRLSRL